MKLASLHLYFSVFCRPANQRFFFGIFLFSSFHKTGFGLVYSNVENFVFRLPLHSPFTIFADRLMNKYERTISISFA